MSSQARRVAGAMDPIGDFRPLLTVAASYYGRLSVAVGEAGALTGKVVLLRSLGVEGEDAAVVANAARRGIDVAHDRLVTTLDVPRDDRAIVSQWVEGAPFSTLSRVLMARRTPAELPILLRVVLDLLEAMAFLGDQRNYLPGGLGPDAVLVGSDGATRLIEPFVHGALGDVARFADHRERMAYRAPEQLDDRVAPDRRADVFSAGVMLWELIERRRLFADVSSEAIVKKIRGPVERVHYVASEIADVVDKALAKVPGERFADAAAMAAALRRASSSVASAEDVAGFYDDLLGDHPATQRVRLAVEKHGGATRPRPPRRSRGGSPVSKQRPRPPLDSDLPPESSRPMSVDDDDFESPRLVGRCELFVEIAQRDGATDYLGRWRGAGGGSKPVVVRALHPHLSQNDEVAAAFVERTRALAELREPNLVRTLDVVQDAGDLYVVQDPPSSVTLAHLLRQMRRAKVAMPMQVALRICADALRGLHAAHVMRAFDGSERGIVHGAMTPESILVGEDGCARVDDFGLAALLGDEAQGARAEGRAGYLAPEQAAGEEVTPQTDVYRAAVILWQSLTGRRLLRTRVFEELKTEIIEGERIAPSTHREEIEPELDTIVLKGLSNEPADRWASAEEMAEALERIGLATRRQVAAFAEEHGQARLDQARALTDRVRRAPETFEEDDLPGDRISMHLIPSDLIDEGAGASEPPEDEGAGASEPPEDEGAEAEPAADDPAADETGAKPGARSEARAGSEPPARRVAASVEPERGPRAGMFAEVRAASIGAVAASVVFLLWVLWSGGEAGEGSEPRSATTSPTSLSETLAPTATASAPKVEPVSPETGSATGSASAAGSATSTADPGDDTDPRGEAPPDDEPPPGATSAPTGVEPPRPRPAPTGKIARPRPTAQPPSPAPPPAPQPRLPDGI